MGVTRFALRLRALPGRDDVPMSGCKIASTEVDWWHAVHVVRDCSVTLDCAEALTIVSRDDH